MDNVMNCLIKRDAVEIVTKYEYGDFNMMLYGKKKKLKDLYDKFRNYDNNDLELLDRLLPKRL
jgi:ferritin-like protein